MLRSVAVRRCIAICLVLAATAGPAMAAGGAAAPAEPAGLVSRLVEWLAVLWAGAPPAPATDSLDGGCIMDPNGGCHGAAAPPGGCALGEGSGCGESS